MPQHPCLDPQDAYAQREVLVAYDLSPSGPRLLAVIAEDGVDILPELIDAQRADLRVEIGQAHAPGAGRPPQGASAPGAAERAGAPRCGGLRSLDR